MTAHDRAAACKRIERAGVEAMTEMLDLGCSREDAALAVANQAMALGITALIARGWDSTRILAEIKTQEILQRRDYARIQQLARGGPVQ